MDGVHHSRLLKIILPYFKTRETMEPFKVKIEIPENPKIKSEVPREQKLREEFFNHKYEIPTPSADQAENYYAPVMKITKQETSFTKGDQKVQKVFVKEDISDGTSKYLIEIPFNPNIQSMTIDNPHLIRFENKSFEGNQISRRNGKENEDEPALQTKKPKLGDKLKYIVDNMRNDGTAITDRNDKNVKDITTSRPSSIPQPKNRIIKRIERSKSSDNNDKKLSKSPEDEFEKLFDEIVDTDPSTIVVDEILNVRPNSITEAKFDELIHDYDTEKVKPIFIDEQSFLNKSKIPLLKRKSESHIKVANSIKNFEEKSQNTSPKTRMPSNENKKLKAEPEVNLVKSEIIKPQNEIKISKNTDDVTDEPETMSSNVRESKIPLLKQISHESIKYPGIHRRASLKKSILNDSNKDSIAQSNNNNQHSNAKCDDTDLTDLKDNMSKDKTQNINREEQTQQTITKDKILHRQFSNKLNESSIENDHLPKQDPFNNASIENNIEENDAIKVPLQALRMKFENLSRENSYEKKIEKQGNTSPLIGEENNFEIQEIDIVELQEAEEVDIEALVTNVDVFISDDEDCDDFGAITPNRAIEEESNEEIIPGSKSVLKKIELFERQSSSDTPQKSPKFQCDKPKIVEEVLKTPVMPRKSYQNNETAHFKYNVIVEIPIQQIATAVDSNEKHIVNEIRNEANNKHIHTKYDSVVQDVKILKRPKEISKDERTTDDVKDKRTNHERFDKNESNKKTKETYRSQNLVYDRKSSYERKTDNEFKRSKSSVDIIIERTVKGKVSDLVVKMGSMERLDIDFGKKEAISAKEMPRRNSVSEKIALFERKLTVFNPRSCPKMAANISSDAKNLNSQFRPAPKVEVNNEMGIEEKIAALKSAKQSYGGMKYMPYATLIGGDVMPVLAVGTALLEPPLARHIVEAAIDLGYRAFDTAYVYGTEKLVGEGIRAKIQDGTVKRGDLFVSSKLWSTFHKADLVGPACQNSLDKLGLDYLDLFMIHNPMSFKEGTDAVPMIANVIQYSDHDYLEAWFAMEKLVEQGVVRSIGLSNFNSEQLKKVLDKGKVTPAVLQVESHPYLTQQRLKELCDAHGIIFQSYGVLGSLGTPKEYKSDVSRPALEDPLVKVMAAGLNITPAQLLISYQLNSGRAVVVKASSADRLWSNLQSLDIELGDDQIKALNALNTNTRNFTFKGMGDTHKNYPFNVLY